MAADADAQKFWNTEWRGLGHRGRAQSQPDELLRPGGSILPNAWFPSDHLPVAAALEFVEE